MKRLLLLSSVLLLMIVSVLAVSLQRTYAQTAGCRDAAGAPVPCTPTPVPPIRPPVTDRDADGVPDADDRCPDVSGSNSNSGCPVATQAGARGSTATSILATRPPAPLPRDGRCVVATFGAEVNVRSGPTPTAGVIGTLSGGGLTPPTLYAVVLSIETPNGAWYYIANPRGWVSKQVVREGGNCATIPGYKQNDATKGAVPNWGKYGDVWFCQPQYDLGEDTCIVPPTKMVLNWDTLGNLTFCVPDVSAPNACDPKTYLSIKLSDILVSSAQPKPGSGSPVALDLLSFNVGPTTADGKPASPTTHRLLLTKNGMIVLTVPSADPANGAQFKEFPLYFGKCPVTVDPVDCALMVFYRVGKLNLPLAACAFDSQKLIQCKNDGLDKPPASPDLNLALSTVQFVQLGGNGNFAACAWDNNKIIQCSKGDTSAPGKIPDLPIAGCAYDDNKLVQCANGVYAGLVGSFHKGKWHAATGAGEPTASKGDGLGVCFGPPAKFGACFDFTAADADKDNQTDIMITRTATSG